MRLCPACCTPHANADWGCPSCKYTPPVLGGFPALAPELAAEGGGFQPEIFEKLAALEARNFWFQARNRLIIWTLKRQCPELSHYLEIGCGTGFVLAGVSAAFPGLNVTGSEIFSTGLGFASRRVSGAELLQMDARKIPYENHFDLIGAYDVLEHIAEDHDVLVQMHRALRPRGCVLLTVPQHPWLWSRQDEYACHVRRYRIGELREKVEQAGFKVELETAFVSLLLPAMLASRIASRNSAKDFDPMAELHLPGILNFIFERVMDLERLLIRSGLRFPAGGSLLLLARKHGSA
jgi:SAM-dependent methyltransferase